METDLFVSIVVSGNSLCLQCFPRFPALQTQFPVSGLQELPRHSQSSLQYNPYFARGQANRAEKINKSIYIYINKNQIKANKRKINCEQ